jgi:hypothetical protein
MALHPGWFTETTPKTNFSFKYRLNMFKPFQKIASSITEKQLKKASDRQLLSEYYARTDGKKADWKRQTTFYQKREIKDWQSAVMTATNPDDPRRGNLMRFYQNIRLDNHLLSVIDTRILKVQRSSFKLVNDKGEENEELKALLERPWFEDIIRLVLYTRFQGTTLIELFDTNEIGEVKSVSEIPQSNFIAQKGLILYEEFDTNGILYKDGAYKDYYFQVGSDWDLGMFNELAIIITAKKLGLGSYMSFIEKYGVPPIFAITERMDTTRRDELFDMLENFKSNHFAVLQGTEKIEIPKDYNVDGYKSYQTLIDSICNKEMSKRVLGGTASTDEKSFTGAAEVQERVAQDRYEADKLLFKYYFNTEIRPRLVKLSSVYKDFANYSLIWDNQETLDIIGYIDGVEKLSQFYDFDIEEIKKRTGLPIVSIKDTSTPQPAATIQKKKSNLSGSVRWAPYALATPQAATWDAAIERLANQIYNGEVKPEDLDRDLVLKNYAAFNKEAATTWGEGYYDLDVTRKIRDNLMKFAGAKAYNLMAQIQAIDAKAGISREAFMQKAKEIVNLHNDTWLTTERINVVTATGTAKDWQQFQADKDIYPNLKWRTMEDNLVRQSHAELDGIVMPVDDWTIAPPIAERCRCRLEQTTDPATHGSGIDRKTVDPKFRNNTGIDGQVWTNENSYQQSIAKPYKSTVNNNLNEMKQYAPYNNEMKAGNKRVFTNDFYDASDVEANKNSAKIIAESLDKDVYIRPHIASTSGIKNPELGIGKPSEYGDLKTYDPIVNNQPVSLTKFLKNGLSKANAQGCNYAVIDLSKASEADYSQIPNKLRGELSDKNMYKPNIKNVIIIRNEKAALITRAQINSANYKEEFSKLFQ